MRVSELIARRGLEAVIERRTSVVPLSFSVLGGKVEWPRGDEEYFWCTERDKESFTVRIYCGCNNNPTACVEGHRKFLTYKKHRLVQILRGLENKAQDTKPRRKKND